MSVKQREWDHNTSTSWAEVLEIPNGRIVRHILVDNFGAIEVEVAFNSTDFPDITIPGKTSKVIDDDIICGKIFVRRVTGLLSTKVRIRVW